MIDILKKYWYFIIVIILFLMLVLINYNDTSTSNNEVITNTTIVNDNILNEIDNELDTYYVDIKGEVNNPGVYEVESDKRVIDVINLAGGLTNNANTKLLNLSKKVTDEMIIRVYSNSEIESINSSLTPTIVEVIKEVEKECVCPSNDVCDNNNDALSDESLININTATKDELMTLPKIGEAKAISIIEYRNNTKFSSIEDIKNVSGIGDSLYESIKSYITV